MSKDILHAPSRVLSESEGADLAALAALAQSFDQSAATHHRLLVSAKVTSERAVYAANKIRFERIARNLRLAIAEIEAARRSISTRQLGGKGHP